MSDVICFPLDKWETLTSVVNVVNRKDKKKYMILRKKEVWKGILTLIFSLTFKATWYNNHKRPTLYLP